MGMLYLSMYVFIMCTFLQFYTHMTYDMYIFGIAGWLAVDSAV